MTTLSAADLMSRIYMWLLVGHISMPGSAERAALSTRDGIHGFDVSTGFETRSRRVPVVTRTRHTPAKRSNFQDSPRRESRGNLLFFAFQSISPESRRNLPQRRATPRTPGGVLCASPPGHPHRIPLIRPRLMMFQISLKCVPSFAYNPCRTTMFCDPNPSSLYDKQEYSRSTTRATSLSKPWVSEAIPTRLSASLSSP